VHPQVVAGGLLLAGVVPVLAHVLGGRRHCKELLARGIRIYRPVPVPIPSTTWQNFHGFRCRSPHRVELP
jgi:hypothetical protein